MCAFFSKLELSVRGKDRGLTEGQAMHLYECKAVRILSLPISSKSLPKHKSLKAKKSEILDLVGQLQLRFLRVSNPQIQSKFNCVDICFVCVLEHSFK
jgi:hypothetical protein